MWKKSNRDNHSLETIVRKRPFKSVGASQGVDCIKSHHTHTDPGHGFQILYSSCQAVPEQQPGLKKTELVCCLVVQSPLFWWEQFLHLIWKPRSQSLEEEWRGTQSKMLEVQCEGSSLCWFGEPCHLLVLVHCALLSPGSMQRLPGHFRALCTSFSRQALWRCWLNFPTGLGTCPHCQKYQNLVQWPWCYCAWLASKLAWPEPHRESMGHCQEKDERHETEQCRRAESCFWNILVFHNTSAVPQADGIHATPHRCSYSCKWGPNQVLRTYAWLYFSEGWHFCI